jgi:hypothetical protein
MLVESTHPLQFCKGIDGRVLVMLHGHVISNIVQFQARLKSPNPVLVHYVLAGSPAFVFADAPEDALSNSAFPLRFNIGSSLDEVIVTYKSRPFGGLTEIMLEADLNAAKPIIRLTFDERLKLPPQELRDALVKLGVEVVVDHANV